MLFCTDTFWAEHGDEILGIDPSLDPAADLVLLTGDGRVSDADLARITIALFSPDTWPDRVSAFMGAVVRCPDLRWLQTAFAGTDHPVFQGLLDRGVTLSTASGATAPAIAQTVMMYLLMLSRRMPELDAARAERRWAPGRSTDLHGLRMGIVGYGAIGAEVAALATAFGIEPIGVRRAERGDETIEIWTDDRLDELVGWADAVVVCAPLTDATRGLFDADRFARMRPGSWFVNVGRGAICDEEALVEALASGHLGGAGLDVFATEPLPAGSPLWSLPNVVMTPHCSGDSPRSDERAVEIMIDNFRRRTAGDPLSRVVPATPRGTAPDTTRDTTRSG